jgi:hypothetical protein
MDDNEYVITTYDLVNLPKVDGYINEGKSALVIVSGLLIYKKQKSYVYDEMDWGWDDEGQNPGSNIRVGDKVYYNKDSISNRIWEIVALAQDSWMITIRSYNLSNIPNKMKMFVKDNQYIEIKVPRSDIEDSDDYPESPPYAPNDTSESPVYLTSSPVYDVDSPPYSAILGRQMTEEEFKEANYRPRSPSYSPPRSPSYSPPQSPSYPASPTIIINTGNTGQASLSDVKKDTSSIVDAVSGSENGQINSFSDLDTSSKEETLNVSKIVDKGNGNKEISILTDVVEEKKDDDNDDNDDSTSKKRITL